MWNGQTYNWADRWNVIHIHQNAHNHKYREEKINQISFYFNIYVYISMNIYIFFHFSISAGPPRLRLRLRITIFFLLFYSFRFYWNEFYDRSKLHPSSFRVSVRIQKSPFRGEVKRRSVVITVAVKSIVVKVKKLAFQTLVGQSSAHGGCACVCSRHMSHE